MLMLASMLHGIGVGNMLPSAVRVVCIDINPAVVTKLGDRGPHRPWVSSPIRDCFFASSWSNSARRARRLHA